jgi:hypothetical protein
MLSYLVRGSWKIWGQFESQIEPSVGLKVCVRIANTNRNYSICVQVQRMKCEERGGSIAVKTKRNVWVIQAVTLAWRFCNASPLLSNTRVTHTDRIWSGCVVQIGMETCYDRARISLTNSRSNFGQARDNFVTLHRFRVTLKWHFRNASPLLSNTKVTLL